MKKEILPWLIPAMILILAGVVLIGTLVYINSAEITSRRRLPEISEIAVPRYEFRVPENTKIFALGEATHGNKDFQVLKLEVFKRLVEDYNYKVFSIEDAFGPGLKIEEYISGRLNGVTSEELATNLGCWIYHTEDIAAIIDYMKEYNENTPEEEHLHFFGFDMQGLDGYELEYLRNVAADISSEDPDKQAELLSIVDDMKHLTEEGFEVNASVREEYTPRFEILRKSLEESKPTYETAMALHTVKIATGLLTYYDQDLDGTERFYYRDRNMAETVKWYDDLLRKNGHSGILVTAHNGHVANIDASEELENAYSFGGNLKNIYGDELYIVGTEFYISVDNVNDHSHFSHEYTRRDHRFTSADPIAYQAKYMSDGSFFLDFDKVKEDTETYKLISNPNYIGLMGEGYVPENDFCADNFRTIMAVKDHFDAMIYYYKVDPIRVLDYEG